MAFSTVATEGRDSVLNTAVGGATLYVGLLHTTDINTSPGAGMTLATITELATAGYARQSCAMGTSTTEASVGAQVTFTFTGTPTGGTATGWFLCTTASGTAGKMIGAVNLAAARTYLNGDTQKVTPTVSD